MHALIYGTGKWATLIGIKLNSLGVTPIFIGSKSAIADFSREDAEQQPVLKNLPVFIASATANHLNDLEHCLKLSPSEIYVEKGFITQDEKMAASSIIDVPGYILSQYRYFKVFDQAMPYLKNIKSITYEWIVEKDNVREFLYHIESLDRYIKGEEIFLNENAFGSYTIDDISKVTISKGDQRNLIISIETDIHSIKILINKFTNLVVSKKDKTIVDRLTTTKEDNLGKMILDIVQKNNLKLERL